VRRWCSRDEVRSEKLLVVRIKYSVAAVTVREAIQCLQKGGNVEGYVISNPRSSPRKGRGLLTLML
jgi:hypothetical protein